MLNYKKNECDDFGQLTVFAFHRKIKKMPPSFLRSGLMVGNIIISPFLLIYDSFRFIYIKIRKIVRLYSEPQIKFSCSENICEVNNAKAKPKPHKNCHKHKKIENIEIKYSETATPEFKKKGEDRSNKRRENDNKGYEKADESLRAERAEYLRQCQKEHKKNKRKGGNKFNNFSKTSSFDHIQVIASGNINKIKEIIGEFHKKYSLNIFKKNTKFGLVSRQDLKIYLAGNKNSHNRVVIRIKENNKYQIALVDEEKMNDFHKECAANFYSDYIDLYRTIRSKD